MSEESPTSTPDDARRKVDELEADIVDEPDEDSEVDPAAATDHAAQQDPESPAAGDAEPPD